MSQFSPALHVCRSVHEPPLQMSATFDALPLQASSAGVVHGHPRLPTAPVPMGVQGLTAPSGASAPVSFATVVSSGPSPTVPSVLDAPSASVVASGDPPLSAPPLLAPPPLLPSPPPPPASAGTGTSSRPAMLAHEGE